MMNKDKLIYTMINKRNFICMLSSAVVCYPANTYSAFFPKKPKNIGVIVLPAWMGIDNHAKESAEALSKLGYHAFVADIYGSVNNPKNTEEAAKLSGYFKNNPEEYQKRIQLAIDQSLRCFAPN